MAGKLTLLASSSTAGLFLMVLSYNLIITQLLHSVKWIKKDPIQLCKLDWIAFDFLHLTVTVKYGSVLC